MTSALNCMAFNAELLSQFQRNTSNNDTCHKNLLRAFFCKCFLHASLLVAIMIQKKKWTCFVTLCIVMTHSGN